MSSLSWPPTSTQWTPIRTLRSWLSAPVCWTTWLVLCYQISIYQSKIVLFICPKRGWCLQSSLYSWPCLVSLVYQLEPPLLNLYKSLSNFRNQSSLMLRDTGLKYNIFAVVIASNIRRFCTQLVYVSIWSGLSATTIVPLPKIYRHVQSRPPIVVYRSVIVISVLPVRLVCGWHICFGN